MLREYPNALGLLKDAGWTVSLRTSPQALPSEIEARFPWVPMEVKRFIGELDTAASPGGKTWLLGIPDFSGSGAAAFKWDEWEQMSLAAAKGNQNLTKAIQRFWDLHFPVASSVKSGYAYFAIQKADLSIVCGEEPEFEESSVVASSFLKFLKLLCGPDPRLSRWI